MKSKKSKLIFFILFLFSFVGFYYFFSKVSPYDNAGCKKCNVVLISVDSLRADHMSLYGYPRKTTPSLDELSKNAVVFNNFFSSSYLTPISEASIHTGLYPEVNGIINFRKVFSSEIKTMAEILKDAGYETAAVGTSHEFLTHKSLQASFSRGFNTYNLEKSRLNNNREINMAFINSFLNQKRGNPFFLWIPMGTVHAPYGRKLPNYFAKPTYAGIFSLIESSANFQYYYDGLVYDPFLAERRFANYPGAGFHKFKLDKSTSRIKWPLKTVPEDLQHIVDMYDNGVRRADEQIADIVKALQDKDLLDSTVIIIQSEHGESLGEHKYIAHYDIWDETTHTPFIFKSPAFDRSQRIDDLVSGVDVLPSLLQHIGINTKIKFSGKSVFDNQNKIVEVNDEIYLVRTPLWESVLLVNDATDSIFDKFREIDDKIGFKSYGIRTKKYKLIHNAARLAEQEYSCWKYISGKEITRPEFEFYDLEKDPGENNPLSDDNPVALDLKAKLLAFESKMKIEASLTKSIKETQIYQ